MIFNYYSYMAKVGGRDVRLMSFEGLIKFARDFCISPGLVPQRLCLQTFNLLAGQDQPWEGEERAQR